MNITDIHTLLEQCDDPEDLAWDGWEGGAQFTVAQKAEEEVDGKWCYYSTVVQEIATGNYYEITTSRMNDGYWGDGERGETHVSQVKPVQKVVTTTTWVAT